MLPATSAGRLITSAATQSAFIVQILSTAAAATTSVTVTSSNASVVTVSGPVVIRAGSRTALVSIATGVEGTAVLRFRANGETSELSIVVGTPPPGTAPPIIASPVGLAVLQQRLLGTLFTPIGGQATTSLTLLSSPAGSVTPVTISSTDPSVASAGATASVPAGSRAVSINILTGLEGVATLTLRAGSEVAQVVIVVGKPPASRLPLVTAQIVGVEVKQ
jgi:hypothetical protein